MAKSAFQVAVERTVAMVDSREGRKVPRRMRRILAAKDAERREAKLTEVMA